ncbi:cytochrome c oxidase assembly protein COX19-like [Vigna radiata var. radiata]|uniref:Cytochrome c oxidase assembly protein COX19-like n=1 Tax=Vigna radiata var. radiata TaxID=3916 RepID=A0A3Q0EWA9_VIGRR|nr:cytochrome c oxidase assembly protein COX19-like [Vigna radiata var. radiata]
MIYTKRRKERGERAEKESHPQGRGNQLRHEANRSSKSIGGAFGGNRGLRPVPPEKGKFPLDHLHLSDLEKVEYLNCLKTVGHQSEKCRQFTKKYLQCRMERWYAI